MAEPLILASKSPRRRELLELMGVSFIAVEADIDETEEGVPQDVVLLNATQKARHVQAVYPDRLILGADTVVAVDGEVFGKPADEQEAVRMLRALSDRWHEVYSGVCLLTPHQILRDADRTRVHFTKLSDEEILSYIRTGEPFDKAGAYAIQGRAGMWIDRIEGSFSNVIGLPQAMVRAFLTQVNYL